jgi:hypothetical protein
MMDSFPQGLKPLLFNGSFTAGLKACSTPRGEQFSGAKAPVQFELLAARLKSCPDTCFVVDTLTAAAKAVLMEAEAAGLKACSTPWGTADGFDKGINACSTPIQKQQSWESAVLGAGAKAQILRPLYAALKGRSSTVQPATAGVR